MDREVERGEAALQAAKGKPSGVLRVTAPIDLAHTVLPRIAQAYTTKYPNVSLELTVTNEIVDIVGERVDIAIRWARALKDSSLVTRRFFETRSNLWASPRYMRGFGNLSHPRDLANAVFVTPAQKKSLVLTNGKSDFEFQRNGRICANDAESIKALVVLGEGIAWLPDYLTAEDAEAGKLVRVLSQWHPKQQELGTCYFVYASRQYALPKVESFIQTALGQI